MNPNFKVALTGTAVLAATGACSEKKTEPRKPLNVVYIMCDDHSYQTISAYDRR